MARRVKEHLLPETVNHGFTDSCPDAGSVGFFVRVRRGFPVFLGYVNLKHVKRGCGYIFNHGMYIIGASVPILLVILGIRFGKLTWDVLAFEYNLVYSLLFLVLSCLLGYACLKLTPRSVYLVDFVCYLPPDELKITKDEYIELAKKSGQFTNEAIKFQQQILKNSGLGDATYLPRHVFHPTHKTDLDAGREEAAMLMFGAVDELLATTAIRPKDISVLVVNCGVLNTTPSLSAMLINRYKLTHTIQSFNLGGMGCTAGLTAVDMANNLLNAYPGSYAMIVSTEAISSSWYGGTDLDMVLPNCFLRMGAAAVLLSNRHRDRWRSKYQFKQLVHTHQGTDERSFKSIQLKEDSLGKVGLSISKDLIELGGHVLKANITTLADYKLAFEHVCILATSRKVLDEVQKNLDMTDEYMEASRKTLERFGNTSSSSIWYELAYLEAKNRIKRGDRVWQLALGSGLKCSSVIWKAIR